MIIKKTYERKRAGFQEVWHNGGMNGILHTKGIQELANSSLNRSEAI